MFTSCNNSVPSKFVHLVRHVLCSFELQDGKLALLGSNGCFISVSRDDDCLYVKSKQAGPDEMIQMRSPVFKESNSDSEIAPDEKGTVAEIEINYV